jgi:hypothetical protein
VASYWQAVEKFGTEAWAAVKSAASAVAGIIKRAFGFEGADANKVEAELVDPFKRAVAAIQQVLGVELPAVLESAFSSILSTMEGFADSVDRLVERIIEAVRRAKAERDSLGSGGSDSGSAFASGGYVRGPGSGTSDSIPAWLSNGEFVIRAAAVRQYGVSFLRALNGMRVSPKKFRQGAPAFAMGGLVETSLGRMRPAVPALATAGVGQLPGTSFNLIIGGETFAGLYAPEGTASALQRYASQASSRSAGRKPGWFK